jgi:hypothetical protein
MNSATKWNSRYQTVKSAKLPPPSHVLAAYTHLLPTAGTALD